MFRAECHGQRSWDCHGQEPTSRCHSSAHSKGRKYGQNVGREGTPSYCHSHCCKSVVEKLQQVVPPQPMCLTQAASHGPSIGLSDGRDRARKAKSMPRSQSQTGGPHPDAGCPMDSAANEAGQEYEVSKGHDPDEPGAWHGASILNAGDATKEVVQWEGASPEHSQPDSIPSTALGPPSPARREP